MIVAARSRGWLGRLPAEVTELVGRRGDVAEVRRLLSSARLVTLTGVGGSGKSRLALRVAMESRRAFGGGVWQVDLAPVTDGSVVVHAVGASLGIRDQTDRPLVDVVADFLRERHTLLVLDNCEHLLDACADLAARMLAEAPALRLLCTSRQPMGMAGEHVWTVRPLACPDPDRSTPAEVAARYPAVMLFTARASAVAGEFRVTADNVDAVVEICARLDGLPLAIELAAARLRALSVHQVAAALRDGLLPLAVRAATPAWHQTIEEMFAWSYRLCSPAERATWARISVFVGSFEPAAAERVCAGDGLCAEEMLDRLAGLVNKSVLIREDGADGVRYRLLETVREYGRGRLRAETPELELVLRRRHRDWYRELARRFGAEWFGPHELAWATRIRAELANLRAALDFCLSAPGEVPVGQEMAADLVYYWHACGQLHEGRYWYDRALAADQPPPDQPPPDQSAPDQPPPGQSAPDRRASRARLRVLSAYGVVLFSRGELAAAEARCHERLAIASALDDRYEQALARKDLGSFLMMAGEFEAAVRVLEREIAPVMELGGDPFDVAATKMTLAVAVLHLGDKARAQRFCAEAREICHQHGDQWWLGYALVVSATVALARGDVAQATTYARASLRQRYAMGDTLGIAGSLERLAWIAGRTGDHERAARLLGVADKLWHEVGQTRCGVENWPGGRRRACQESGRAALGDGAYETAYHHGAALDLEVAMRYALDDEAPTAAAPSTQAPSGKAPSTQALSTRAGPRITAVVSGAVPLSRRECQVADLVAEGLSNKEIATRLVVSPRTAEAHVESILRKLGFQSRAQIAAWVVHQRE